MTATLPTTFLYAFEKFQICIQISLEYVPKGPINNKSSFVQILAWHQSDHKQLTKQMIVYFTDTYMPHLGSMS